jgi:tetrahydromethanopterin S-methyltransferase subunit H
MKNFSREQKVYSMGGVQIGGQPGQRPMVLGGSIFFNKHVIVTDPAHGEFDRGRAQALLERDAQMAARNAIPRFIDPIGETAEALIKYIEFVAAHTDAPILVDSPRQQARMEAIEYFAGGPLVPRLIYNSIAEDLTPEELASIRKSGIKSAIVLAFSATTLRPADRVKLLRDTLLPAAEEAGIENIAIDTGVLDLPSVSLAAQAITLVKEEFGFPAGCAPANALFIWERTKKHDQTTFQAAAAAVFSLLRCCSADFILYGPMRFAPWAYPACAAADGLIAYGGRFEGMRPATKEHPLYRIF